MPTTLDTCLDCIDPSLFKKLNLSYTAKVKIGNCGIYINIKGREVAMVNTAAGIELIEDALFFLKIGQDLLSVPQMLERKKVLNSENMSCDIFILNVVTRLYSLQSVVFVQVY